MAHSADIEEFHMTSDDLKDFRRDLLATVFNETHSQLLLYQQGKSFNTTKLIKSRKPVKTSKVGGMKKDSILPEEVLNDIKLDQELDALRKIYNIAYETLTEEDADGPDQYAELFKAIEAQNPNNNNNAEDLTNQLDDNRSLLRDLDKQLKKEQNELTECIAQKSQRVRELRDKLDNMKRINNLEIRLVEKWEKNRLCQATILGEMEERQLLKEILDFNRRMDNEKRLICEIQSFRSNEITELKQQIVDWEEKFKTEKSQIITKNFTLTQNIAEVVKSHEKHYEITEQRKHFVAEYLRQRAEEKRLYEEQLYRVECAVRIQAWWRGMMVRKGLGPYRKKAKKGGKKSKGKK